MTHAIYRLQYQGRSAIRPGPQDGHGKLTGLTPAGRAARERAVVRLGRALAPLAATLPAADPVAAPQQLREPGFGCDRHR